MTAAPAQLGAFTKYDLQWSVLFPFNANEKKAEAAQAVLQLPAMRRKLELQFRQWGVLRQLPQTDKSKALLTQALRALRDSEQSYERVMRTLWEGMKRAGRAGKLPPGSVRIVDVRDGHKLTAQERQGLGAFITIGLVLAIFAGLSVLFAIFRFTDAAISAQLKDNSIKQQFTDEFMDQARAEYARTGVIVPELVDLARPAGGSGGSVGTIALAVAAIAAFWFFSKRRARA